MPEPVGEEPEISSPAHDPLLPHLLAVFRHYSDLGFISFGGPGVHVVLLRKRFVDELKWVDPKTFTDLFSLGNALPGPGSFCVYTRTKLTLRFIQARLN
jgi:chromate transport protein ChrA